MADFFDGIEKASEIYPDAWYDEVASPDVEDSDLIAWHELSDRFMEQGLEWRAVEEELEG